MKIIFIYIIVFVSIVQMLKGAHYKLKHSVVNISLNINSATLMNLVLL